MKLNIILNLVAIVVFSTAPSLLGYHLDFITIIHVGLLMIVLASIVAFCKKRAKRKQEAGMKTLKVLLTPEEASYLSQEMDTILRSYNSTLNGSKFTNKDMGNAFNKVFRALAGRDHENMSK